MMPAPDSPSATFILLAYNQEKFIADAVYGALSQNYQSLEIILSDDSSTDNTFYIMNEMANNYNGRHKLKLFKNRRNLGISSHVLERMRESSGEYIILAAGDDISKPSRVEKSVDLLRKSEDTWGISTGFDLIDESGVILKSNVSKPIAFESDPNRIIKSYIREDFLESKYVYIQGATAAYRKNIIDLCMPENSDINISEDSLFNFLIYANGGRVRQMNSSTIYYRKHAQSLTNRSDSYFNKDISCEEKFKKLRLSKNRTDVYLQIEAMCARPDLVDKKVIMNENFVSAEKIKWESMSFLSRLKDIMSSIYPHKEVFKWKLLRLWGYCPDYEPLRTMSGLKRRLRSLPK